MVSGGLVFAAIVAFIVLVAIVKTAVIVPQKTAYIVERLGRYRCTLDAGFHILIPFFDRIAYKHTLKEQAIDVPPQECITKDNIMVSVDGILYMQVMDPAKASYGIGNYLFATTQLAQTTMRSEMGKLDLDRSFEERTNINQAIVAAVDKASDPWGIKVTRYEIKNITPPRSIQDAMEKQMRAEREKRAMIAESEGERQSKINRAEGERQQAIALSEGERARRINEAEGKAKEILLVAEAQATGISKVAEAINGKGGVESVNMQLAQQYLAQFGNLAKTNNTMIIPSNLADVAGVIKACTSVVKKVEGGTKLLLTIAGTVMALAALADAPKQGVPAGCDPSVMSEAYWQTWNADEQAKIDADIEANRKADAVFAVDAPEGTVVTVEQIDHDFRFGAHIFNYDQLGKKEWNDAYKASYGAGGIFNQATVAFYWNCYEPVPGRLRAFGDYEDTARFWDSLTREEAMDHPFWRRPAPAPVIDYLRSRGVAIHGHILIWGSAKPNWIYDWYCPENEKRAFDALGIPRRDSKKIPHTDNWDGGYNNYWRRCWREAYTNDGVTEASIAAMAPTFAKRMPEIFRKRVFDVAAAFGEVVDSWDVVNESSTDWTVYRKSRTGLPVWKSNYGLMPGDYPLHALLDAKEAFPSMARLAINDYNISDDFLSQVKDLELEGSKIDIVGCQMHIFDTNDCMRLALGATNVNWVGTPQTIQARLDMMAKTGKPLHVSEITITSPGANEKCRMIQAILTRNIYRKWFSHKALMGITWWNTVDGGGVKGEPLVSGLFTRDMKKKPAYEALDELINHEWKTRLTAKADAGGKVAFCGFRGKYRLTWKDADGKENAKEFYLK